MNKGQALYKDAKEIIPGGTQLLSKRPEMFLPNHWPAYYSRASGCQVWDLDDIPYYDMSYMGIGACTLGYACPEVDNAVKDVISRGQMSTLNAPEEVELAHKLLDLHPWAGGVRYAKAGGEALAMAIRIARAGTGEDRVLFCGYHGWHDWYLAANLSTGDSLSYHHLAGLEPAGVPAGLAGTNLPFRYNDLEQFLSLINDHSGEIAAIIMEPIRNEFPSPDFLETIREVATQKGIVLIFDEVTAGFRISMGGSHLALGVEPDMCVFGKAIANGYPIAAVIGRKHIMRAAQNTFISSTFHTERIGFAAALAAIKSFEELRGPETLMDYGRIVKQGWQDAAANTGIAIKIGGIDPLAHFQFVTDEPLVWKTYFTQEMLKRGYLAVPAYYASLAHSPEIINSYLDETNEVFSMMARLTKKDGSLLQYLDGPVCHAGFQRLN